MGTAPAQMRREHVAQPLLIGLQITADDHVAEIQRGLHQFDRCVVLFRVGRELVERVANGGGPLRGARAAPVSPDAFIGRESDDDDSGVLGRAAFADQMPDARIVVAGGRHWYGDRDQVAHPLTPIPSPTKPGEGRKRFPPT